jgi:hypothetical protein
MDPKHRNEPKQTEKNYLLVSRNKPKMNRNRLSFGLFRFEPKTIFCLFRGHPSGTTIEQIMFRGVVSKQHGCKIRIWYVGSVFFIANRCMLIKLTIFELIPLNENLAFVPEEKNFISQTTSKNIS